MTEYAVVLVPLPEEDGGGFAAIYPDLPGCMSDGDTPEEALENAQDAFEAWMAVQKERGVEIPQPGTAAERVNGRIKFLVEALKSAFDYLEDADAHIEYLEDTLEKAIQNLDNSWKVDVNLLAIAAKEKKFTGLH